MSTHQSFKVLASITPNVGIAAVPYGEMKIRNDGILNEWNVTFTLKVGGVEVEEWILSDFGSYSTAFNAAARKALEISIERDLIVQLVKETTE